MIFLKALCLYSRKQRVFFCVIIGLRIEHTLNRAIEGESVWIELSVARY